MRKQSIPIEQGPEQIMQCRFSKARPHRYANAGHKFPLKFREYRIDEYTSTRFDEASHLQQQNLRLLPLYIIIFLLP